MGKSGKKYIRAFRHISPKRVTPYIYGHQHRSFTPLALHMRGKKKCPLVKKRQPSVCGTATSATAEHEVPTHVLTASDNKLGFLGGVGEVSLLFTFWRALWGPINLATP